MPILQHRRITDYAVLVLSDKKLLYIVLMSNDHYGQYLKKPLPGLGNYISSGAPIIHINLHGFLKDPIQTEHRVLRHTIFFIHFNCFCCCWYQVFRKLNGSTCLYHIFCRYAALRPRDPVIIPRH